MITGHECHTNLAMMYASVFLITLATHLQSLRATPLEYYKASLPQADGSATTTCDYYKRQMKDSPEADNVARKFMNCWGHNVEHGQSDLVILIDKSGSMREDGWKSAMDFVTSLLSEVKIAFNATRIAIGTFATKHEIELNYLYNPTSANHKCR